jgi:hypothetical protein
LKPPQIFQHEFLQNFSINMFCKVWTTRVVIMFCSILLCAGSFSDALVLFYPPTSWGDDCYCVYLTAF